MVNYLNPAYPYLGCGVRNSTNISIRNNYYGGYGNLWSGYGGYSSGGCSGGGVPSWMGWMMGGMMLTGIIGGIANLFGKGKQADNCGCYQQYQQPGYQGYYQQPGWGGGYQGYYQHQGYAPYQNYYNNQNAVGSQGALMDAKRNLGDLGDKDIGVFWSESDQKVKYFNKKDKETQAYDSIESLLDAKKETKVTEENDDEKTEYSDDEFRALLATNPPKAKKYYEKLSEEKKAKLNLTDNEKVKLDITTVEEITTRSASGTGKAGGTVTITGSRIPNGWQRVNSDEAKEKYGECETVADVIAKVLKDSGLDFANNKTFAADIVKQNPSIFEQINDSNKAEPGKIKVKKPVDWTKLDLPNKDTIQKNYNFSPLQPNGQTTNLVQITTCNWASTTACVTTKNQFNKSFKKLLASEIIPIENTGIGNHDPKYTEAQQKAQQKNYDSQFNALAKSLGTNGKEQ
ncbi:MAG: hypothetical protein LBJ74_05135, partial [Heliobacteriaceae bacterium]|nr:hypothetical protein [Heliobacteriaceae bacterium]